MIAQPSKQYTWTQKQGKLQSGKAKSFTQPQVKRPLWNNAIKQIRKEKSPTVKTNFK